MTTTIELSKSRDAFGQYESTLRNVRDRELSDEIESDKEYYFEGIHKKIGKYDQKVAKRIQRDAKKLTGSLLDNIEQDVEEKPKNGLAKKIFNIYLPLTLIGASLFYMADNNIKIDSYTAKKGDGFSNVAYELNMPTSAQSIDKLTDSYVNEIGTSTLHPGVQAEKYLTGRVRWNK